MVCIPKSGALSWLPAPDFRVLAFEAFAQGLMGDAQHSGGNGLVAVRTFQGLVYEQLRCLLYGG